MPRICPSVCSQRLKQQITRQSGAFLAAIVIVLLFSAELFAATYRYKDNAPPAKMMLDMMEVMGVIERVPDAHSTGGTRWPMNRLWGMSPSVPGGGNPMSMGNPLWSSMMMGQPWQQPGGFPPTPASNFSNGVRDFSGQRPSDIQQRNLPPHQNIHKPAPLPRPELDSALWSSSVIERQLADHNSSDASSDEPVDQHSITDTKARYPVSAEALQGVWLTKGGELLRFSGRRFLWKGVEGKPNVGMFMIQGNSLTTNLPEYNATVRYQLRLEGNKLTATTESGHRYEFTRQR